MNELKNWSRRPADVANLFNPAFLAALINRVAVGYSASISRGLPFSLAFVAIPLILHPPATDALPRTARANFHGWLLENPQALIGFAERAQAMAPLVREAISYGLNNSVLTLDELRLAPSLEKQFKKWERSDYNRKFSRDSQLLGKLLGQVSDVATIFALFGIRP